jgi:hypothetical protein
MQNEINKHIAEGLEFPQQKSQYHVGDCQKQSRQAMGLDESKYQS